MHLKHFVVSATLCLLWCYSGNVYAQNERANKKSGGVSEELGTNSAEFNTSKIDELKFDENYKKLLSESSSDLDIKNDSAEVIDEDKGFTLDSKKNGLKFDDFVSKKELEESLGDDEKSLDTAFINVFKVPKTKTKKTFSAKHSSIKNEPVINDFNSELLFALNEENFTSYETYFHAFTHLYDHNKWNVNMFSINIGKMCLRDMKTYLNDLRLSKNWAVKVSDASGRYRGQFFFENSFWVGSKQFCYEINEEYKNEGIPELQFFVFKFVMKLEPVRKKVSKNKSLKSVFAKG